MKEVLEKKLKGARAVVIGGGLAGFAAAISLAVRGARVRVMEREPVSGGRLRPVVRAGYQFTPGGTTLTHPHVLGRLFVQADLRLSDFLEFQPVDPTVRLVFPDGRTLDLYRDVEKLAGEIERFSPDDASLIRRDLRAWERLGRATEENFLTVPDKGWATRDDLAFSPALWRSGWPLSIARLLRGRYKSPAVPAIFEYLAARHGASVYRAPAIMRGTLALELVRGAWIARGGTKAIIEALERVCQLHDVSIVHGAKVERIELEGGHVRRVSGQGFKALRADIVVSTVDAAHTYEMLPKDSETAPIQQALGRQRPSRSAFTMMLGCDRQWDFLARHETVLVSPSALEMSRQVDAWRLPANEPSVRLINESFLCPEAAPENHTALQITVPAPCLTDRFRWSPANSDSERDRVLARIKSAGVEKLREGIVAEAMLTPADWAEQYHLAQGSQFGAAMNSWRGFFRRWPNAWSDIPGLHQAGSSAHPGAAAPFALLGGMLAAEAAAE